MRLDGHLAQVVALRVAGAVQAAGGLAHHFQRAGKAHLEELVHVGRDDGQVAQPLQQRHIATPRLGLHPAVELQDGAFAVQQHRP